MPDRLEHQALRINVARVAVEEEEQVAIVGLVASLQLQLGPTDQVVDPPFRVRSDKGDVGALDTEAGLIASRIIDPGDQGADLSADRLLLDGASIQLPADEVVVGTPSAWPGPAQMNP